MQDEQLLRYSRHLLLPELDVAGQERLLNSRVLIVGLGGLGSPVAMYLAAAGIGSLYLADDDQVEISNLQRQIIHQEAALGQNKALSASQRLAELNSGIQLQVQAVRLSGEALQKQVAGVDLVCDCTDNFATRFELNRACQQAAVPLVSAAAIRFSGQLAVFDFRQPDSPCYACLYPEATEEPLENCNTQGVLSPLVGVMGSLQAVEAIKLLAGCGQTLAGRLLVYDALNGNWKTLRLHRDEQCAVCSGMPESV